MEQWRIESWAQIDLDTSLSPLSSLNGRGGAKSSSKTALILRVKLHKFCMFVRWRTDLGDNFSVKTSHPLTYDIKRDWDKGRLLFLAGRVG